MRYFVTTYKNSMYERRNIDEYCKGMYNTSYNVNK